MSNNHKNTYIFALIFLAICTANAPHAYAQRDFTTDPIKIVKPYQPKLLEAQKIATNPQAAPANTTNDKQSLNYAAVTRSINTDFKPEPIQALKPKSETPNPLENFFVRAGFGNYKSPLLDVHYQTGRRSKYEITADIHHLSARGTLNTNPQTDQIYTNMAFSDNKAAAHIKRIFETVSVGAGAGFERNGRRFFGYDPADTIFTTEQSAQNINRLNVFAIVQGTPKNKGIPSYKFTPTYKNTANKYQESEQNINLQASIFAPFERSHISIPITYDFRRYNPNTGFIATKQTTGLFTLNPRFGMQLERIGFEVGINTAHQQLQTSALAIIDSGSFHVFPFAKVGFNIIENQALTAFVGIDGGFEQNTFENITRRNPFIKNNLDIRNTMNKTHIFAGINGQIIENLTYKAQVGIKESRNLLFYVNDTADFRKLAPVYAQSGKITEFALETQYKPTPSLDIALITTYKIFSLDTTLRQPYMQPNLSTHLNLRYNYDQIWYFGADIFGYGGIKYLSKTGTTNTLKGAIDLNLMAEYRLKNNLSFFANFNNLAASHYFRFYNYPTFGINVMGGITYKF